MSLESVAEDIREQARAEAEAIREQAEAEAERVVTEAESEAEEIVETRKREVERQAEQEREQRISSAKLEAKQLLLRARRDALDEVRSTVEDRIADLDDTERAELMEVLLDAAVAEFDADEHLIVHGRSDDRDLLTELAAEERLRVGEAIECLSGVVVEGTTTDVRVDNTFDAILEDVWDDHLRDINNLLFEA